MTPTQKGGSLVAAQTRMNTTRLQHGGSDVLNPTPARAYAEKVYSLPLAATCHPGATQTLRKFSGDTT